MDLNSGRMAPTERNSSAPAQVVALPRKSSLVTQEEVRSHSRTHSLPTDINKFIKKPPGYNEATKQLRKETEVNLNDILEIISKQDSAVEFEVSRNPETGLVTLKEATRDTPKTSQIVTPDIKTPVIINNSSSRLFEKENVFSSGNMTKQAAQNNHFEMKFPGSNSKDVVSFKGSLSNTEVQRGILLSLIRLPSSCLTLEKLLNG